MYVYIYIYITSTCQYIGIRNKDIIPRIYILYKFMSIYRNKDQGYIAYTMKTIIDLNFDLCQAVKQHGILRVIYL